jgi:hypothetical protein
MHRRHYLGESRLLIRSNFHAPSFVSVGVFSLVRSLEYVGFHRCQCE